MNTKTHLLSFLILLLTVAPALGQPDCKIGVYADPEGRVSVAQPWRDLGDPIAYFDVYYILFTEDFVNAVAWNREVRGFNGALDFISQQDAYGTFLDVQHEGFRLGIGTCVIGFGGVPIVLMRERVAFIDDYTHARGVVRVLPNVLENPDHPVYNTCNNEIKPCRAGQLSTRVVVPNDGESWGRIKSLYGGG